MANEPTPLKTDATTAPVEELKTVRVRYVGRHRIHFTRLGLVFDRNEEHEMTTDEATELQSLTPGEEFEVE